MNVFAGCASVQAANRRLVFAYIDIDYVDGPFVDAVVNESDIDDLSLGYAGNIQNPKICILIGPNSIALSKKQRCIEKWFRLISWDRRKTPEWLRNEKIQFFTSASLSRSIVIDPVPWDATYLALYKKFLAAAAAHLKQAKLTPYVFAVGMVAPS